MRTLFLGVDPGQSGGVVLLSGAGRMTLWAMPKEERKVWALFTHIAETHDADAVVAMIEQVQGYIGHAQPAKTAFTFGAGYGGLRMAMIGNGVAFEQVTPLVWQRRLGIPAKRKGEKKGQYKRRLLTFACNLFPRYRNLIGLGTCDALLLAEYARRLHTVGFTTPAFKLPEGKRDK